MVTDLLQIKGARVEDPVGWQLFFFFNLKGGLVE